MHTIFTNSHGKFCTEILSRFWEIARDVEWGQILEHYISQWKYML